MFDVKNKTKNNDLDIIIDDDVWIASNTIILKVFILEKGPT